MTRNRSSRTIATIVTQSRSGLGGRLLVALVVVVEAVWVAAIIAGILWLVVG